MSRSQTHRFWIQSWDYLFAQPEYQQAVMVSIEPPVPQGDRLLANFGARTEAEARAELAQLRVPRGHKLVEVAPKSFTLKWQSSEGGEESWNITARTQAQLLTLIVGIVVHERAQSADIALHLGRAAWKEGCAEIEQKAEGVWSLSNKSLAA